MKKSEYYKDILEYIEARLGLMSAMDEAQNIRDYHKRQLYMYIMEQRQKEITKWLNEDVDERESNSTGCRWCPIRFF